MIFAFMLLPMTGFIGAAIDYGRALKDQEQMQAAVDSAVLAAGRTWQTSRDVALAETRAKALYDTQKPANAASQTVTVTIDSNQTQITVAATGQVPAPFMAIAGFETLPISARAVAQVQDSVGKGEKSLEISMMLDVTGSMSGQKIEDLKLAAKDLIEIVIWSNQGTYTSKVAIAPFEARVNVGEYAPAVTGQPAVRTSDGKLLNPCVTERTGTYALTDEAPGSGAWVGTNKGDSTASNYNTTPSCSPSEQILPLTTSKSALKDRIDAFTAGGSTAGQLGTAWAWYMLSPKWSGVWTGESVPKPYGQPKLQKIAILMTDGEYNTYRGVNYGDGSSTAQQVSLRARQICTGMKAAGIVVYTVGFGLGGNQMAIDTLSQCAQDPQHFYNTTTGDELRQAFRDIALRLVPLRITQ